jgi:hypothetical protein
MTPARRIASLVWPRHSEVVEKINRLPLFEEFVGEANGYAVATDKLAVHEHIATGIGSVPIDYFELGVNAGKALRLWLSRNTHPSSRFYGFDSFKGSPAVWTPKFRKGAFDRGGQPPDISDLRLSFEIGWFHETLPIFLRSFQRRRNLIMHHDADLYGSTLFCLASMGPAAATRRRSGARRLRESSSRASRLAGLRVRVSALFPLGRRDTRLSHGRFRKRLNASWRHRHVAGS